MEINDVVEMVGGSAVVVLTSHGLPESRAQISWLAPGGVERNVVVVGGVNVVVPGSVTTASALSFSGKVRKESAGWQHLVLEREALSWCLEA